MQNAITVSGNLTADPELRSIGDGAVPRARMRIAVNRRIYDKERSGWQDRHDGYFTVIAWRDLARHAMTSLRKGDRVVVTGRLSHRLYDVTTDGTTETRQVTEIEADDLGGSLKFYAWSRYEARVREATPQATATEATTGATTEVASKAADEAVSAAAGGDAGDDTDDGVVTPAA